MNSLIYLNGQILKAGEATVPALDHGLLYGDGLFETIRICNGKPFMLREHLERLLQGAEVLEINIPNQTNLADAVLKTVVANSIVDGHLRLTVTRGPGPASWDPDPCKTPTVMAVAHNGLPYSSLDYEKGFPVLTSRIRRNPFSPLVTLKSLNFMDNIMAKVEARKAGCKEALLLNTAGNVAEGSLSNVFIVNEKNLATPHQASGLLPGIARALVIKIAREQGIEVEERVVTPEEFMQARECFLTNSLMDIMPVTYLDGKPMGDGRPGPVTLRLLALYRQHLSATIPTMDV